MSIVPGRDVPAVPEEWTDAVNKAINDAYHEDLCMCDGWPEACASGYQAGQWDLGVSLDIAVGVLEPLIRARIAAEVPLRPDRAAQLLECIKSEPGQWTGLRASRAMYARFGWDVMPDRAVQIMRKLVGRGQLVVANPPRGATFVLPFGPGGEVEHQWATVQRWPSDSSEGVCGPTDESLARRRARDYPAMHRALLRREVKYGPWVEVDADEAPK